MIVSDSEGMDAIVLVTGGGRGGGRRGGGIGDKLSVRWTVDGHSSAGKREGNVREIRGPTHRLTVPPGDP